MIYKRCSRCNKRIQSGTTCKCMKIREYAKAEGVAEYYHTAEWQRTARYVINIYNGIDVYALYKHKRYIAADTVHHIIPLKENYDKRRDIDNLIPVSKGTHAEIEKLYRQGYKARVQKELRDALNAF